MPYDAVIFDIDGTLWDASAVSADGWNAGLAALGIARRVSTAGIRSVTGNPYEVCVDILLPGLRLEYPGLVQTLNDSELAAIRARGGEFFTGAIEGVRKLGRDFKIFLVSNCQPWYLELFLGFSGIEKLLAGSDCHGASGLPKDGMLRRMKNDYRLTNPVYVGDTAGDQIAAGSAGIDFIYVSWGFGRPAGDARSVDSFPELVAYLRGQKTSSET
jgi:phosphoglycolate phosphatase